MPERTASSRLAVRGVALPRRKLWMHLGVSLLVCLFVIVAGGSNTGSTDGLVGTAFLAAIYWVGAAVLQIRWWRKGYNRFWRPTYSWAATLLILVSFLGLPLVLLFVPRLRRWVFRVWKPYDPAVPVADHPETGHQTSPVDPAQEPIQPAVQPSRSYSPPPVFRPVVQPWQPKPQHPYRVLTAMLVGCALAFPVAALAILTLFVLGGEQVITVTDGHDSASVAGVVAAIMVVATAAVWADKSRNLSRKARSIGWSLIVLAAVPGLVGTVYFTRLGSPQNLGRPSVRGRAEVGSVLTADPGRWTHPGGGPLSVDVQWEACGRRSCLYINGATHRIYAPTRRDLHRRIRFLLSVTATSGVWDYASDWVTSAKTAPVIDGH